MAAPRSGPADMRLAPMALLLGLLVPNPGAAQELGTGDDQRGRSAAAATGGVLFSYRPHDGRRQAFEDGYARHLEWHRERGDSLMWYAWDVVAGPRAGQFVDGTFGTMFDALDARVDPAGDAADAAETFLPHAVPTGRRFVRLRADLGTATPLEDVEPWPFVQLLEYAGGPATASRIEEAVSRLRRRAGAEPILPYTVYEALTGTGRGFLLLVWRDAMGSFDEIDRSPGRVLDELLADLDVDARVVSELWRYRADLTYLGRAIPNERTP